MPTKKANELHISRVYDAPVKMVWDAWVDPEQVKQWWGPRGFTLTTKSKDVHPGGLWIYTMHGPDGVDWPNRTLFHEVEKYSRLVYDHGATETTPPLFRVTVTFEEVKGKTKMEMTMTFESPEKAREIGKFIKQASGNSTWDRLAEYLEHETSGKDPFVINRSFEAPIERVYEMWTNPSHFASWMGPTGSEMKMIKQDIRVGGGIFYSMNHGETTIYGKIEYKEIIPNQKLVYVQHFSDPQEQVIKPYFAPTWPDKMITTVLFTKEDENQTRITLTWEVFGEASDVERKTFHEAKAGMTGGWTGSFDKLEEVLKK